MAYKICMWGNAEHIQCPHYTGCSRLLLIFYMWSLPPWCVFSSLRVIDQVMCLTGWWWLDWWPSRSMMSPPVSMEWVVHPRIDPFPIPAFGDTENHEDHIVGRKNIEIDKKWTPARSGIELSNSAPTELLGVPSHFTKWVLCDQATGRFTR